MTADDDARAYARHQIEAAEHGRAHNQCRACGVYRTDGKRPVQHRDTCTAIPTPPPPPLWRTT